MSSPWRRRRQFTVALVAIGLVALGSRPVSAGAYREKVGITGSTVYGTARNARGRGLQHVLITTDGVVQGKPWRPDAARLTFHRGQIVPPLLVVRTGQDIELANAEDKLHTLRASVVGETLFYVALPRGFRPIRKSIESPGLVNVRCELHHGEQGWIAVLDHPYFAITDSDGRYEIGEIPAGTYRLSAWHEGLRRLVRWVSVSGAGRLEVNLELGEMSIPPGAFMEGRP